MKLSFTNEKMTENSKYSIALLASVLIFAVVILFAVNPLREDIARNEASLIDSQQKLASYQTFAAQHKDYDAFEKKQQVRILEAQTILPDMVTIPQLIEEYSILSKKCEVELKSVRPPNGKLAKVNNVFAVPIQITISGNYYKVVDFIQQIENGKRFGKLQQVDIVASDKALGTLTLTANFVVYSIKNSLEIKPINAKG